MAASKLLPPGAEKNRLVVDPAVKGLYRRIQDGKATFVVRYMIAGKARQKTLVATKVADARIEAGRILVEARLGRDIVAETTAATVAAREQAKAKRLEQHRTIGALADRYLARGMDHVRPTTRRIREHYLREVLAP